jgi:serine/threonine protein kinase
MEGLIMERLTASPYITDIYGFCGATSMLEVMPREVNEIIQPGRGRANQTRLDQLDNVYPENQLFPVDKAHIALEMAEALAALHGFRDGAILHGDNHIDQFLADSENFLKLGDFNLATIPEWNDKKGEYCKREREPWAFQVSTARRHCLVQ